MESQYETKVILKMVTEIIVRSKSLKQAYEAVAECAQDEGFQLPKFEEKLKRLENDTAE